MLQDLERTIGEAAAVIRQQQPEPVGTFHGFPTDQLARQPPPAYPPAQLRFAHPPQVTQFEAATRAEAEAVLQILAIKNRTYGNSALEPVRIFSTAEPLDQILVRIDDKLARIRNGHLDAGEDTIQDLIGYLLILQVARKGGLNGG